MTLLFLACGVFAQESNNGKQLWAKSYLNRQAPELKVDKWLTDVPDTCSWIFSPSIAPLAGR